jgi:hypothetical protein
MNFENLENLVETDGKYRSFSDFKAIGAINLAIHLYHFAFNTYFTKMYY